MHPNRTAIECFAAGPLPPEPTVLFLRNGMRVLFAERANSPLIELRFVCDGGFAADPPEKSGCAGLATAMMVKPASPTDRLNLAELWRLGASIRTRVTADAAIVEMSALTHNFRDALMTFSRMLSGMGIREDLERARVDQLATISREKLSPIELAVRIFPEMLYPFGHRYARPFTGSGTEKGVAAVTAQDINEWRAQHLSPRQCTLVVAGAPKAREVIPLLERAFGRWRAPAIGPKRRGLSSNGLKRRANGKRVEATIASIPNISQSAIFAGILTVPRNSATADKLIVADAIVAGTLASRLNMNLREDKGWTYGVHSRLFDARCGGWWLIGCLVRDDRANAALDEIHAELENMTGRNPPSEEELRRAVKYLLARLRSDRETCSQMADAIAQIAACELAPNYHRELCGRLLRLDTHEIADACGHILTTNAPRRLIAGSGRN